MGIELDTDTLIVVVSAVGIGLTFCALGLLLTGRAGGRRYQRRLNTMQERAQGIATSEWAAARSLSRQQSATRIDRFAGNWLPRRDLLLARLERTGRAISIGKYAMTAIGLGALSAIGFAIGTGIGIVPSLVIGLLVGTAVPHLVIGRMGKRRLARFINLFPDAIDLVVRALRSGLPVTETLGLVASEIPGPVGEEFKMVTDRIKVGRTMEDALQETADRLNTPEFSFFVITLAIQRETGGNLAETLSNLSEVLRKRAQMKLKIRAMSSESKASAYIVGALPFVVFSMIWMVNPGYIGKFFIDERLMVTGLGGGVWMAIGAFIMAKMVSFEI